MRKTRFILLLFFLLPFAVLAQITGGRFAFEYLRLPNSPHISALGGINVCNPEPDISFALQNPSMMRPGLHNQIGLYYNSYYAGIKIMNLGYGYHAPKINTSFALAIQYLNYGNFTGTDEIGNIYGEFKAVDYNISLGASKTYKDNWRYGAALKLAYSHLYDKFATGLLADVGVTYFDTTNLLTIGIVAKNMGVMLKKYNPENSAEPLPFDLQIGISKRFAHLPLRLMATIHHLYEWDIRYNNPDDIVSTSFINTGDSSTDNKSYFADKLFRHFIFAAELTLAKRLSVIVGYNHLRRAEMAIKDKPGSAGFSFGASIYLNKFQIHYARSFYSLAGAYNEFGFNMQLNKLFHIGNIGEKINWNASYAEPKL